MYPMWQFGSFPFVPPVCYAPPITEHVRLHSKFLRKNVARVSGVAHKVHPLNWGHKRKNPTNPNVETTRNIIQHNILIVHLAMIRRLRLFLSGTWELIWNYLNQPWD